MPSRLEEEIRLGRDESVSHPTTAFVADTGSKLAVVVTHPWGVLGGDCHNNVVVAATLFFQKLGITTVRFDFCGTQLGRGYVSFIGTVIPDCDSSANIVAHIVRPLFTSSSGPSGAVEAGVRGIIGR